MNNYPDDIRMYDNDPRSPFYVEPPTCEECEEELEQDIDCDDYGYYVASSICTNMDCVLNNEEDKNE
jgi:hypothetical protein